MQEKIAVLDHGYVMLIDHLGDDQRIADSARVSYGKGTTTKRNLEGLIDYLVRHDHTSPLEQVVFTFEVKVPLFVARQWLRHRTLSANEVSARYSEVEDEFYIPTHWREQDTVNKQGSAEVGRFGMWHETQQARAYNISRTAHGAYRNTLADGVAREMARMVLPQNVYTSFVFTQNLHNLLHFLRLRLDSHAQAEMRQYAGAIAELVEPIVPLTWGAWVRHVHHARKFSSDEMAVMREVLEAQPDVLDTFGSIAMQRGMSQSRVREFIAKLGQA